MTPIVNNGDAPTRRLPPARIRTRPAPHATFPTQETPGKNMPSPLPDISETGAVPSAIRPDELPLAPSRDYAVGHCPPPKHSQFKAGQSGNPKGRPRNAKGLNTIIRELTLARMKVRTARGEKRVPGIEVLVMKLLEHATKGNMRALESLLRLYAQAVPDDASKQENAVSATPEDVSAADKASLDLLRDMLLAEAQAESALTGEARPC